jgi:hypothetical protein
MEELLKIAKEKYPVGCVFKSAYNPTRKGKVTHLNFYQESNKIFTEKIEDEEVEEGVGECLYNNGVWAEIISRPEVEEPYKFPELQPGGSVIEGKEKFEETKKDNINPSHYTSGKIECIDAIESALSPEEFRGFLRGNVLKYNWRAMQKNGVEDLKKAIWYEERLIKTLENESKTCLPSPR